MRTSQSVASRGITSVSWNLVSHSVRIVVCSVRTILMVRWLPVEIFGVYGLAVSMVALFGIIPGFGMAGAFLHRCSETEDEEKAAAVHFTIKLILTLIWTVLMTAVAFMFAKGQTLTALLVIIITATGLHLTQTPALIFNRRIKHRRLAVLSLCNDIIATPIALVLAWKGLALWALLSIPVVEMILNVVMLYLWRPVWRPRLAWSSSIVSYFLRFGSRNFLALAIQRCLNRLDDLWTAFFLGKTALGFYSKAYSFANYPGVVLATPVDKVVAGVYAELKTNRYRLSRAFFIVNAFFIRSGFFLAGLIVLVAPEFIRLVLGEKWFPMLDAFRFMLVFTMLEPIKANVGKLLVAVGRPGLLVRARFMQLAVMIAGLFLFTQHIKIGIAGVAIAVNIMLLTGIVILLRIAVKYVDFSLRKLFLVPVLSLVPALFLAAGARAFAGNGLSDWHTGFLKAFIFSTVYWAVLLVMEKKRLVDMYSYLAKIISSNSNKSVTESGDQNAEIDTD